MPRGRTTAPETDAPPAEPTGTDPGPSPDPASERLAELLADVRRSATEHGRDDLAARLDAVAARIARTETVVCVVGEFKKGKSALINALLASPVCPVDDDLATTAVTVVGYAERPTATVRRREAGELIIESIPADDVAAWVLERDEADRRPGVEIVEVRLPNAFLERGISLVDTPGVGGLNAGHAAATLAFLPSADALVFVTDASAELSGPELEFLASAMRAGPPILLAVTKVDMYPEWRRIVEIDERHLGSMGLVERPFALSSVLRMAGDALGDPGLERDSGFPAFSDALVGDVVGRARTLARAGAIAQIGPAIEQIREPLAAEMMAFENPDDAERMAQDLRDVRTQLATLSEADASWSIRLEDEFAALRTRITFAFQGQMRQVVRDAQDELEKIDPADDWPAFSGRVQERTATTVRSAFLAATDGAADVQSTIARLLADEEIGLDSTGVPISFDPQALWQGGPSFDGRTRSGLVASIGIFTGASVGIEMLGMLGTLLGAAIVGPAVLGVALVFGGKGVLSERRRQLADRRQQARTFLVGFAEEVRFEADGRLASLLDEIQRQMRARFADRIRELYRTYTESAGAMERAVEQAEAGRTTRLPVVRSELEALEALRARAADLEAGGAG
jgi:dynamin family protein